MKSKFKFQRVSLDTATIVSEGRLNNLSAMGQGLEGKYANSPYSYIVSIARQEFKAVSMNQKYSVGSEASVLLRGKKCELLYDAIFFNNTPFCLNNPVVSMDFFDGEELTRLHNIGLYTLKKTIFTSQKKRIEELKNNPNKVSANALIIRRESKGEAQIFNKAIYYYHLTVLIKIEDIYALTVIKCRDVVKPYANRSYDTAFIYSTGEIIPIFYEAGNIANNMIDKENVKPFSLELIPRIEEPNE